MMIPCPAPHLDYIQDINTGLSYRETYRKRITPRRKQILMPTPLQKIDGFTLDNGYEPTHHPVEDDTGSQPEGSRQVTTASDLGFVPLLVENRSRGRRAHASQGIHRDGLMAWDVLEEEVSVPRK
jgi:hypothetical protein